MSRVLRSQRPPPTDALPSASPPPEEVWSNGKCVRADTAESKQGSQPLKPVPKKARKVETQQPEVEENPASDDDGSDEEPNEVEDNSSASAQRSLPPRHRDRHPGAPDKKRGRRSTAEMDKDEKKHKKLLLQIAELEAMKKMLAAKNDIAQQRAEKEEDSQVIHHVSQIRKKGKVAPSEQVQVEEKPMVLSSDDDAMNVDDISEDDKPKQKQRERKPARGATRAAIDKTKDLIQGGLKTEGGKKELKKKKKAGMGTDISVHIDKRPSHLAGIQSGWLAKASKARKDSREEASDDEPLGGLADSDLESPEPSRNAVASKGASISRPTNDYVTMHIAQDEDSDSSNSAPARVTKPNASKGKAKALTKATPARKLKPKAKALPITPSLSTPAVRKPKVKHEISPMSMTPSLASTVTTPDNESEVPAFIAEKWSAVILPTLYHAFFASKDPFGAFSKEGESLQELIQSLIDDLFPGHSSVIARSSKVVEKAYARLNEKRTQFGTEAIAAVDTFFAQPEYIGNPRAVVEYTQWALQPNGPALFAKPAPAGSPIDPAQIGYVKPIGLYESQFIIATVTPLLNSAKGSRGAYGHPLGAISLAAAAVERAFLRYATTGIKPEKKARRDQTELFSRDNYGDHVGDYLANATQLSDNAWRRIQTACGGASAPKAEQKSAAGPSLSSNRRILFLPSSPVGSDED